MNAAELPAGRELDALVAKVNDLESRLATVTDLISSLAFAPPEGRDLWIGLLLEWFDEEEGRGEAPPKRDPKQQRTGNEGDNRSPEAHLSGE
jgi:hypothetical protein